MNVSVNVSTVLRPTQSYEPLWIWITSLLPPLIFIGNVLVIVSYQSNRLLHTKTYTFLVSLAVSDLIVGVIDVPMWIECMVNYSKCTKSQRVFKFLDLFGAFASILHLTAITIERYIAICRPYFHERLSSRFHKGILVFVWTFSLLMAGPSLYFESNPNPKRVYVATVFALGFCLPVTIILSMYIGIFRAAKSLLKRQQRLYQQHDSRRRIREDHKVAVTVAFVCGFFIVAWLPFFMLSIIAGFFYSSLPSDITHLQRMIAVVKILHYGNSMVNPIIYAFRDSEMRNTFKRILRIKICCERLTNFYEQERSHFHYKPETTKETHP